MNCDTKGLNGRVHGDEARRSEEDGRDPFMRDKARIMHSAGFRRLQGKTQVMGVGEGDFHRTRLTHSLEVSQIAEGILEKVRSLVPDEHKSWLPSTHLVAATCFAHDLGHPPYGHGGERALHDKMKNCGGFEGNAQTLRLLVRLEKYKIPGHGINPTKRLALAVLKYPTAYSSAVKTSKKIPPKCYYDSEHEIIERIMSHFPADVPEFHRIENGKTLYKSFDASIMDCADDIAFSTHDLEDIVARKMITYDELMGRIRPFFRDHGGPICGKGNDNCIHEDDFRCLFNSSHDRKQFIGRLVHVMLSTVQVEQNERLSHPLLSLNVKLEAGMTRFRDHLRDVCHSAVTIKPEIQMLERRGQRVIHDLFDAFMEDPEKLVPKWDQYKGAGKERGVSDFIAGMTDSYAAKIYHRLFTPGFGTATDEL